MKFQALIDGVHFNPKKGSVKIVLIAASNVSLDELTTIGPKDESIQVTFESEQTKFEVIPQTLNIGDPITLNEEGAERLKDAAEKLQTRQPFKSTGEAKDEDEEVGGAQGGVT